MDPNWRAQLHNPTPPTPLPPYLQTIVDSALTAITPSLFAEAPPSSLLIIGPPSSGKSLVTTRILSSLHETSPDLLHLPLTGLLHSTPLRAWRHLATLLSKQSHTTSNVQQCLQIITTSLSTLRETRTPLVLTLDHFDRFITTTDGTSQTVLYSLLNYLQDRHMRIALVASTTCIDVTDNLEKRVKSRFLHRQLVIPLAEHPSQILDWVKHVILPDASRNPTTGKLVRTFLAHERCVNATRKMFLKSRVVAPMLHALDAAVFAALHGTSKKSIKARVVHACDVYEQVLMGGDGTKMMLETLTELEIVLLMALRKVVKSVEKREEKVVITFTDVFRCYENGLVEEGFSCRKDRDRLVERGVAEKSWERLVECGLVVRMGHGPREMRSCLMGVAGVDVDTAFRDHDGVTSLWKDWGKKA